MQRLDSLNCLDTLRQTLDRWIAIAPPPIEIAQHLRSTLRELDTAIDTLQTQLQAEHTARRAAESQVLALRQSDYQALSHDCKKAEVALQESEARYRRIIETATEGIWMLDAEGKTSFANGRLARLLGYEVEDLIDQPFLQFVHPGSKPLAEKSLERLRHGIQEHHDLRFCGNRGRDLWAIVSATPVFNAAEQFTGILAMITDITERKYARAKLEHSLCLLQTILESTVDGILAIDIFGNILNMNRQFIEQWGLPDAALSYGNDQDVLSDLLPLLKEPEAFLNRLQTEQQEPTIVSRTLWELHDGRIFERCSKPLMMGDSVIGRVISSRDITEQKRAEAALEIRVEQRTAELRSTNRQLQQEITQRKQIEQSLRESQVCLRLINSISTGITAGLSVEQLIEATIEHTAHYFPHLRVQYSVIDAGKFRVIHSMQPATMPSTKGLVDISVRALQDADSARRTPILVSDVLESAIPIEHAIRMVARQSRAFLKVPVKHSATQVGYISLNAPEPRQWSAYEIATLTELADYLSIALQKAQAQQERQQVEERLRLFESVVINGNDAVIITDSNTEHPTISYVNAAFTEITGFLPEEVIGKTPRMLQGPKTDHAQLKRIRSMLLQGKSVQAELINYRKDGSEFWVDINIVPITDAQSNLTHFVALQRDITDRKWSEKALIATQTRLKYLLSSNPSVIYTCQPNRNRACTFVSENIAVQLGYEIWQYLKDAHFWVDHVHPHDLPFLLDRMAELFQVGELTCEYRFLHHDGQYRWLRDSMKLSRDRQGHPIEIIGAVVDITQRKWAEDQIRASLQEKEVMLKEIHHRVKNNLQVISSLLKLQAGHSKDPRIREIFKESQNRVRAMALIHEKLYQAKDLAKTDFAEYIRSLVTDLFRSYSMNSRAVQLELHVEEVRLSIDTAIPCGLIINELISNSLKYAFPRGQAGKISIHLHTDSDENQYVLVVQDNGIGFPEALDFQHTESLGLQLVYNLTQQLQGTLTLNRHPGSTFTITFAEPKSKG